MNFKVILFLTFCFSALLFLGRSFVALIQSKWMQACVQYIHNAIAAAPYVIIQPFRFIYEWFLWGVIEPKVWIVSMFFQIIYFMGGPNFILCCLFFGLTLYALITVSKLTKSIQENEKSKDQLWQKLEYLSRQLQKRNFQYKTD